MIMQFLINTIYKNTNLRYETQIPLNKNIIIYILLNFNIHLSAIINTDTDSLENA